MGTTGGELAAPTDCERLILASVIAGEAGGPRGVAVKCIDITKHPVWEGSFPARY